MRVFHDKSNVIHVECESVLTQDMGKTSSRADGSPRAYVLNILSKQIVLIVLYLNGNINVTSYAAYSSGSMTNTAALNCPWGSLETDISSE